LKNLKTLRYKFKFYFLNNFFVKIKMYKLETKILQISYISNLKQIVIKFIFFQSHISENNLFENDIIY
jgi:hypothetical protein